MEPINRVFPKHPRKYPTSVLSNRQELAAIDLGFIDALKREEIPWTPELQKMAHDAIRVLWEES